MSTKDMPKADGLEVFHWPETRAFLERLGVSYDSPTRGLTVRIYVDEVVTVTQEFFGVDAGPLAEVVETTTVHNDKFRTYQPPSSRKGDE